MTNDTKQPPIFVVGAPRSGTTLLAAMLAAHSRLSCGPETRFFRFLSRRDQAQLLAEWPDRAIDFLYSIRLMEPVPDHYGLTREQIHCYLEKQSPSVPAILASLTEQYMERVGKVRWVEKSPEHLLFVQQIRSHFPASPIIRIVRDPRDVALSMVQWPNGPDDFLEALFLWRDYDSKSEAFFETDGYCLTIAYEDLVGSPEAELKKLCAFIGEAYEPQMLDTSQSAASVMTEKESWKRRVARAPDQSRIGVWRRQLTEEQILMSQTVVGDRLVAYGYENAEGPKKYANVYPSPTLLLKYRKMLTSLVDEGIGLTQPVYDGASKVTIFVGSPDRDQWLSYRNPDRWWDTAQMIYWIVKSKLTHRKVYWVVDQGSRANLSYCARSLSFALEHLAEISLEDRQN